VKASGNDDIPILRLTRHTGSPPKGDVMPIMDRINRPARPGATPAARATLRDLSWPAAITLTATAVFIVFLVQATLLMALVMALATLVAGGILLTLVSGTGWITQLRHLAADPRQRH
jgi:hypothetical protein